MDGSETDMECAVPGGVARDRLWISRGSPGCVHYWVGTGERRGGRERFECRWCGAVMAEPLEQAPGRGNRKVPPPGFAACGTCGESFHWTRTVRNPAAGCGRICLECLEALALRQ